MYVLIGLSQVLSCMLWAQNIRMNRRLSVFPWITFIQRGSGLLSVQLWIQSGFIQDIFWSRFLITGEIMLYTSVQFGCECYSGARYFIIQCYGIEYIYCIHIMSKRVTLTSFGRCCHTVDITSPLSCWYCCRPVLTGFSDFGGMVRTFLVRWCYAYAGSIMDRWQGDWLKRVPVPG